MSPRALLLGFALLLGGCGGSSPTNQSPPPAPPPPPPGTLRVLMLGNSLTYTWGIPSLLADMAAQAGELRPVVTAITGPFASLESHWTDGVGLGPLRTGTYDVLIMQQIAPDNGDAYGFLLDWSGIWADEARRFSTRPFIYAVWPPEGGELDVAITNSTNAANAKSMGLLPVAHAFRIAAQATPAPPIYGLDGYNPSPHGAWLAALVMSAMLFERPVADFPNVITDRITPSEEAILRSAAAQAVVQFGLPGL